MLKKLLLLVVLAAVGFGVYIAFFKAEPIPPSVLVFSKTDGFRHDSIGAGITAIEQLGKRNGYKVVATEDNSAFNEANLRRFSAIVFLNTTLDILTRQQQVEMERYIQAGGGFVGVHAAADTEYAWPWYGSLVGAYFDGHPNNPNVREAAIDVINPNHASTDFLPQRWVLSDEWYNFKAINPNNKVLLNLDESSYEGGTNGANHPIAWYKEFDGGRMFYTGLGHTAEAYSDELFLQHLAGGIEYAMGASLPLDYSKAYSELMPEENRFTKVMLTQSLNEPMELDFLDANRIVFVERKGAIHVFDMLENKRTKIADIPVHTGFEDGLLGIAVDPNYAQNNWIYLFYSPLGEQAKQHVSRFVLDPNSLALRDEKVVLEIPTQRVECCHSGGSLEFGPNGNLFISVGDDTNPHESNGYGPIDERDGRSAFDAQKSSANSQDLRGKILRIKPQQDGSYSIPQGNLFASDTSQGRPEIYTMGNRNPFRISIDAETGYLYWGDVGPDARESLPTRGPVGYDELNEAKQAGNFGWPYFIADNQAYIDYNFDTQESSAPFDPAAPVNDSPNNTGARNLPPAQGALIYYPYAESDIFPLLGSGARNAMAGPIYYSDQYEDSGRNFPAFFDGKLIMYDWMRQWLFILSKDENGEMKKMNRFLSNMSFNNTIDMMYGPDGALYVLEYGTGWFSQNPDSKLSRIEFTAGNRKPVAKIDADKTIGGVPLNVGFAGRNSIDYDGDPLTFTWDFGNGDTANDTNPNYTYKQAGTYTVTLTIEDDQGNTASTTTEIMVGNAPPSVKWHIKQGNQSFFWPNKPLDLVYEIQVDDAEDGSLSEGAIDPTRVIVSIDYLQQGYDKVDSAIGHAALAEQSQHTPNDKNNHQTSIDGVTQLMTDSNCFACHNDEGASIGPSYAEVKERYKTSYIKGTDAHTTLVSKIIEGGSGNWGNVPMPAHPALSREQAEQILDHIILPKVASNKASAMPPQGNFVSEAHLQSPYAGNYVLTASYTDQGGTIIGPLNMQDSLVLRSSRIEAEDYDEGQTMVFPVIAEDTPGVEEDMTIIIAQKGKSIVFKDLDLSGVAAIKGMYALAPGITSGGVVEYRLGSSKGQLIGSVELEQSLTNLGLQEPTSPISKVDGKHDLYLVFTSSTDEADALVTVIDWIEFMPAH